jgi:hypothetical protein
MKWPFVSRSRYEAVEADRERIRGERDQFLKDRKAAQAAAEKASALFTQADEELAATTIVNACLTEDLTKLREQLAASTAAESALAKQIHEMAQPVEQTDEEMDAINLLIQERDTEKRRADHLQQRLDQATGLDSAPVAAGAGWQERREQKMRFDK